jgi:ribonuclease HI
MGIGAVIIEPNGTRHTLSQATHSKGCNNEAELKALLAALRELRNRGATALLAYCDNSVVVEQLGGGMTKPIARLASLFDETRALLKTFDHAKLHWIPRHRNGEADELARAALGIPPKRVVKPLPGAR